jgi:hypothetical protein
MTYGPPWGFFYLSHYRLIKSNLFKSSSNLLLRSTRGIWHGSDMVWGSDTVCQDTYSVALRAATDYMRAADDTAVILYFFTR